MPLRLPGAERAPLGAPLAAPLGALLGALLLAGCSGAGQGTNVDPEQVDSVESPELGACRVLAPEDVAQASNATRTVDCSQEHTAQTFAVGQLPAQYDDAGYDDEDLGRFAYRECSTRFEKFLGADESLAMRTVVSWAWFRPSEEAWDQGARWYRCDIVGGGEPEHRLHPPARGRKGPAPGPDRRPLAGVRRRADGRGGGPGSLLGDPLVAGGDHHQAR